VLDCAKLLVQCQLETDADLAMQQTELVVLEPEVIDSSDSVGTPFAIVTDENPDSDTSTQLSPPSLDGVEIETLPPSLSAPATH
jgi:hypothetical protein